MIPAPVEESDKGQDCSSAGSLWKGLIGWVRGWLRPVLTGFPPPAKGRGRTLHHYMDESEAGLDMPSTQHPAWL